MNVGRLYNKRNKIKVKNKGNRKKDFFLDFIFLKFVKDKIKIEVNTHLYWSKNIVFNIINKLKEFFIILGLNM